jgi:hypothetical protein
VYGPYAAGAVLGGDTAPNAIALAEETVRSPMRSPAAG